MFVFLANVRNMSRVPCLQESTYELPADASKELRENYGDYYPHSYITLKTLLEFDYDRTFEDRRGDGGSLLDIGKGETISIRKVLGETFFRDLEILKSLASPEDVRIIFHFD